ncbi:hypothetical protein DET49_11411 [Salegentibacter sp. 24]|uniref:hypothetical protein n=1 Tax=Salegentibacter sp. 24 TaxID=2183986 RepID=UPI00105C2778|nr:hypothetical protein [Salegentibacter sp. 24]TDN87057.1 hypothetical protein DET49_11411 [Salegentibacter sp. 24]
MHKKILLIIGLCVFLNTGCSSVQYTNPSGEKTAGILTYPPKPYILVERGYTETEGDSETSVKGEIKVSLISLPDTEKPLYLKQKSGLGSTELNLTLENGMIKTYGSKADTKIPETITSVAGLISSISGIGTPQSEADKEGKSPTFELYEINMEDSKLVLTKVEIQ